MADQTPNNHPTGSDPTGHDPLGDRLRTTFAAEHADIERRHLAHDIVATPARSLKWVPFAVAAAVIAIAGFVFIANRSNDQAVELDVAAQTPDTDTPDVAERAGATPGPTPPATNASEPIPFESGVNMCGGNFAPRQAIVRHPDGADVPALAAPEASGRLGIVRMLLPESVAVLTGGCARGETSVGPLQWYEIVNPAGGPNEWVLGDYLHQSDLPTRPALPANAQIAPNECGENVPLVPHFVWDIPLSDPDGGLVAHTMAGVDTPVTRVIPIGGVVVPTRGCVRTANGSAWYQIYSPDGSVAVEWVNARYLQVTEEACIVGEQNGAPARPGASEDEPFFHTIQQGELLSAIAEKYNVTVDVLIRANPEMDPNLIINGQLLRVPGAVSATSVVFGPIDGWAVVDGERVAFVESLDPARFDPVVPLAGTGYRWYPVDGVAIGAPCFQDQGPLEPVCLAAGTQLIDLQSPEPVWTATTSVTAWTTGRIISPPQAPGDTELVEVTVLTEGDERLVGLINRGGNGPTPGHCVLDGVDSLADVACTRVAGADRTTGLDPGETQRLWVAGDPGSTADHFHDFTSESSADCTRIVITFGDAANEDVDGSAATLPPVNVDQGLDSVRITANGWQVESAFMDTTRIDYPGGIGLLTLSQGFEFAVELMHRDMEPHVRFMQDPARVVIDLFPVEFADATATGPFGERFVLREPIQHNLTGQGIPVDNDIVVAGFGRPFEAAGLYRIWSVADDVDAQAFLADPPEPLIEEFFATFGSADAWGSFFIPLPDLDPGSYIAVFGELPPTDEIGFYGTGQLFRIVDTPSNEPGSWPEAVLLPNVQLAPES